MFLYLELNNGENAKKYLGKVLELDINHQGAQIQLVNYKL
ncbi:hypothetical protein EZS27_044099 [termite gut metagenome]|uniref:Uncharacterized protein n=1 Tax=termite gut metagenome TaxID=433724 RepID=A0A5J4P4N4_9ZZZZ